MLAWVMGRLGVCETGYRPSGAEGNHTTRPPAPARSLGLWARDLRYILRCALPGRGCAVLIERSRRRGCHTGE